jgi:hypothetical protein
LCSLTYMIMSKHFGSRTYTEYLNEKQAFTAHSVPHKSQDTCKLLL